MEQLLPRGFALSEDKRIKRMVASGDSWQIYTTNVEGYALAVSPELFSLWVNQYRVSEGLFLLRGMHADCRIFAGDKRYLISSMEQGPYVGDSDQVNAFSVTFKKECDVYPDTDFHDAIYIEELSRLLPVSSGGGQWDPQLTYGTWLCAGVKISVASYDRFSQIMKWMSAEALEKSVRAAGFSAGGSTRQDTHTQKEAQTQEVPEPVQERNPDAAMHRGEPFRLAGRPALELFFNDHIVDIVLHREQYERMGISFPGATILHGPPGCGKTYAVDRLCEYLGWPRFDIDSGSIGSTFIHDTSKKIGALFKEAMQSAPSIIVIDEMEAFLTDRGASSGSGTHHVEEVAEFLRRIPEATAKGVLIFAMTNMLDKIDSAIVRRGRFDHIIEVGMPSAEEVESLLNVKMQSLPVDGDVDVELLARKLANRPLSDVTFVLREAGRFAVKRNQENMNMQCFLDAMEMLPKQKEKNRIGFYP